MADYSRPVPIYKCDKCGSEEMYLNVRDGIFQGKCRRCVKEFIDANVGNVSIVRYNNG